MPECRCNHELSSIAGSLPENRLQIWPKNPKICSCGPVGLCGKQKPVFYTFACRLFLLGMIAAPLFASWGCTFDATGVPGLSQNNNNLNSNHNSNTNENHFCGNDIKEGTELCDGEDLDGETCETLGFEGGALDCTQDCLGFDTTGCEGTGPVCGNDEKEGTEVCDGEDLGGETCETLGFESGTLGCTEDCLGFDASECEGTGPVCGNDIKEGTELCDGEDLGGETCATLGFDGGNLQCTDSCEFDTAGCYECGDNEINGSEDCDGEELGGATCATLNFDGGNLQCTDSCEFDTAGCYECGDNEINGSEICDGTDLGGVTCDSLGLLSGDLECLSDCSGYDTSSCTFSPECASVALPVSAYNEVIIESVSINGGDNVAFLSAGENFSLSISYSIEDCGCSTCIDQIEIGFVPGDAHSYCAYDGVPGCGTPVTGSSTQTVTAPSTPGFYDIRFGKRQDYGCFHSSDDWWGGTPPESRTIGAICVTD